MSEDMSCVPNPLDPNRIRDKLVRPCLTQCLTVGTNRYVSLFYSDRNSFISCTKQQIVQHCMITITHHCLVYTQETSVCNKLPNKPCKFHQGNNTEHRIYHYMYKVLQGRSWVCHDKSDTLKSCASFCQYVTIHKE